MAGLRRVLVAGALWSCVAGCAFDRPSDVGHSVGGSLDGTWEGAITTIDLTTDQGSQTVRLDRDGTFVFPIDVADGVAFAIAAHSPIEHVCMVANGTGVVAGSDVARTLITCHGPRVRVDLSAPIEWGLQPDQLDQHASLTTLTSSLSLRAVHEALTAVSIDGVDVDPGQWSAPRSLAPGQQNWNLTLHVGTLSRTYRLGIDRGARAIDQVMYGKASNSAATDMFGAGLAISGDVLVVGAPFHDENQVDAGAIYVFRRLGSVWSEEAYLRPAGQANNDRLGPVAVSGDLIVAGAPGQPCALPGPSSHCGGSGAVDAGAAYVFRHSAAGWQQEVVLKASNPDAGDMFGSSVAIDDGVVVIGAPGEDSATAVVDGDDASNAAPDAGAAYVFTFDGALWRQAAYLKAPNAGAGDAFGVSVSIHGGDVAIGAPHEASGSVSGMEMPLDDTRRGAGAAYTFRAGQPWHATAYLKGDATAYKFGTSIAIGAGRIVVGAPEADSTAGRAYVYERSGGGWSVAQPLVSEDIDDEDDFGSSVAMVGDLIAVGARGEGAESAGVNPVIRHDTMGHVGATYLFRKDANAWIQEAYLKASNPDGEDLLGSVVVLNDETLCVSAPSEDSATRGINGDGGNDGAIASGAIYCFR